MRGPAVVRGRGDAGDRSQHFFGDVSDDVLDLAAALICKQGGEAGVLDVTAEQGGDLGAGAHFSVVVVSVRPEADTPDAIAAFASSHGLKSGYYWLTGTRQALSKVWDSYGVGVQVAAGDLAHSSIIYLIDRNGAERIAFGDVPDVAAVEGDVRFLESR